MSTKHKKTQPAERIYNISGGIHAGRDVIQGDQYNYQVANVETPAQFVGELQKLGAQIAALKQGPLNGAQLRNLESAEQKLVEAKDEAQKPQPTGERIQSTLGEAKETLELLGGGLSAATALGTALGTLATMALKLFGG
jgi:hypothetical protein